MKRILVKTLIVLAFFFSGCFTPHGIYHIVKPGQTLYTIAKTYNVSLYELMKVNKIRDPTKIKPGDRIFIPGATRQRYVPSTVGDIIRNSGKGESASKKKSSPVQRKKKVETAGEIDFTVPEVRLPDLPGERQNKNRRKETSKEIQRERSKGAPYPVKKKRKKVLALKIPEFIWPVEGVVTSPFGWRGHEHHDGIDIGAPLGTPIRAAADGVVIYSGNGLTGYGNMIVIKHTPRVFTVYAHNKRNLVRKGQRVKQGQIIGYVGKSGRATGPHLHFEIRIGTRPVDPLRYLPRR